MNGDVNFCSGYVCGVICSDGKVVWDETHGNYSLSLETMNKEFAELFFETLKGLIEKKPKIRTSERKRPGQTVHMNVVSVYGRKTVEHFVNRWDLSFGRRNWSVPNVV